MIIFIDQHSTKNNILKKVFHQDCLQNMSAIPPITPDLCTFTEELLREKVQNPQNFP